VPEVLHLVDSEAVHTVMHPLKGAETDDEIDEEANEEYFSMNKCITLSEEYIKDTDWGHI
jgi:hypothetical protein